MKQIVQQTIVGAFIGLILITLFYIFIFNPAQLKDANDRLKIQQKLSQEIQEAFQENRIYQSNNTQKIEEFLDEDSDEFKKRLIKYEDMTEEDKKIFDEFNKNTSWQ